MRTKVEIISFEQAVSALRNQHFDVRELPEVANPGIANPGVAGLRAAHPEVQSPGTALEAGSSPILIKKHGAGAILARRANGKARVKGSHETLPSHPAVWIHPPGFLVRGEIGSLLDRGYQKFWKIKDLEIPATADSLRAVHRFGEEVREAIGEPVLYNESLGTTSDLHFYDRVQGRDLPPAERPKPAWELPPEKSG